ncbi:hypothetical protein CFC21_107745 [Triticum aestivum]|uniref:DCD domain-containing protein n=2 Tax=Triticum aestivum TaxID=4565 RepID=A0A3B6TAG8_WHEAT|nr:uncharacterized protein LOC123167692 [Triticum aestivum]KAF7107064.1 hypothetical protein CFC21_107745 [Triticum aestivum]
MNLWMGKVQSKNVPAYDGAIFLCNHLTRKECFHRKLFGLSSKCTEFIHKVKSGATLFLYDVEQRKLHGVFEATSDGAMNIIPDAYASSGFQYPCQIRFKRIWFCKPLMESEFEDAVQDNYYFARNKFNYGLTHQQVVKLLHLFSSRNRLQPRQNPRLQVEPPRESDISSVVNQTDNHSGSNSSHGSLKSACQTCTSSSVGEHAASPSHKLSEPMSLKHRELQLDISDVAKSNSSRSSLHTAANTDVVTEPGTQEAVDDKFTDDYIPLQLEDDTSDGVDTLFDLLGDESHSSESKGSSDSEENTAFHQPCVRKKDDCHQPLADSKLRADIEGRKSVFARLMGRPESFVQRQKFKTKPFPSKNAKSFSSPNQRRKRRRAQQSKSFPCDNRATLCMPSAHKMIKGPALDYSFVWDDDRRSNKFSGGKPSNIQRVLWNASTKEPDRYGACKRLFVSEGSKKLIGSSDRMSNKPPLFAEVHERCKVTVEEKTRTPFLDFKRHAKDLNVEGGDPDYTADVEEAATKKTRLASASYHGDEDESETALVPKQTRPMDMLTVSDENCKLNSISLLSNDTCTQMAGAYLETEVQLKDEQQRIQGCREDVTGDTENMPTVSDENCKLDNISLSSNDNCTQMAGAYRETKMQLQDEQQRSEGYCEDVTGEKSSLGDSGNAQLFRKLSFGDMQTIVETGIEVGFGHVDTETSLQEKQNQSGRSCYGVVDTDTTLIIENPETMESLPNHDEDGTFEMVATDHQDTSTLPQGKDGEATNQLTDSEDDKDSTNNLSPNRRRSTSPPRDLELSKEEEMRYQSYGTKHGAAHEISDSSDSFAICAEGYGSQIGMSTDSTSIHLVINELGTNSESRTSFFDGSCDKESNKHPLFAEVHEICKVTVEEEIRSPFLDFTRCAKDPNVEGGDPTADVQEIATKKMRLASASYHGEEYESETALVPKDTKPMDMLTVSDENCKLKSISLSSNDTSAQMAGAYLETEVPLHDEQKRIQDCCEDVTGDTENMPTVSDENCKHTSIRLSSNNTCTQMDGAYLETEVQLQDEQQRIQSYREAFTGDTEKKLTVSDENCKLNIISLSSYDTCTQMAGAYVETEVQLQDEQQRIKGSCEDVTGDKSSVLGDSGDAHLFRRLNFGDMETIVETGSRVGFGHVDTETSLKEKQNQSSRSCHGVVNTDTTLIIENPETMESLPSHDEDGTLETVATDPQDTGTLPQGKDGEATNPLTGSEDDENTTSNALSPNRRRSSSPPHDVELSKAEEMQYQSYQAKHIAAAHEMSDSTDSFVVCAEDYGSKIGMSTNSTSVHLVINELGTNTESMTSFFDSSCDRESNKPLFAEVHESCKVIVEEEISTPFLDFKRRAKDPNVEGGDSDYTADVQEAARKKTRLASASYHGEEYESETALVPNDTKPMDMLTVSDENCKLKSISLSSNDRCTQLAGAYLETKVQLQDEQQRIQGCCEDVAGNTENMLKVSDENCKLNSICLLSNDTYTEMPGAYLEAEEQRRIQGCCEDVTGDKSSILGDSGNANLFHRLGLGDMQAIVETGSEAGFGHVDTETSLQEKQNQSARSCSGGVNADKMLIVENSETMESSPSHDEDGTLEMVATDHQDTITLMILGIPQGKDGEAANPLTGSEDDEGTTSNTMSPNRRRSSSPPHDLELRKAEEMRCQSYQTKNVAAAHEMSDSTDSFTVCGKGYGSKSGVSTDSTSVHLVVNDFLGTNSGSRSSFFDGSSSEPAEMIMLSHDPGVEMEPH